MSHFDPSPTEALVLLTWLWCRFQPTIMEPQAEWFLGSCRILSRELCKFTSGMGFCFNPMTKLHIQTMRKLWEKNLKLAISFRLWALAPVINFMPPHARHWWERRHRYRAIKLVLNRKPTHTARRGCHISRLIDWLNHDWCRLCRVSVIWCS